MQIAQRVERGVYALTFTTSNGLGLHRLVVVAPLISLVALTLLPCLLQSSFDE